MRCQRLVFALVHRSEHVVPERCAHPEATPVVQVMVQQVVMLHEEVLREITLVANRLGASPSVAVNLAWSHVRSTNRFMV